MTQPAPAPEHAADVAVALFVFNRPDLTARVIDRLRQIRPRHLLVVADGPRPDRPDDPALCQRAREVATDADWDCEIRTNWSDTNLGCDRRLLSGIDWIFEQHERAIVVEDDVLPDPSCFPWFRQMLDRYEHDDRVAVVAAHNEVGTWGDPDASHVLARHVSMWGWASWARSWRELSAAMRSIDAPPTGERPALDVQRVIDHLDVDPLHADRLRILFEQWLSDDGLAWDMKVMAAMALTDRFAAVSSRNLVANLGCGPEATRTTSADDISASKRVWTARPVRADETSEPDPLYDRRAELALVLSGYLEPEPIIRMAKFRRLIASSVDARDTRDHVARQLDHTFAPVRSSAETRELLAHLQSVSHPSALLDRLAAAFSSCP